MSIVFKRYDIYDCLGERIGFSDERRHLFEGPQETAEGEWVKAQDAYDKCAVLSAEIATLKAQLKDATQRVNYLIKGAYLSGYGWTITQHPKPVSEWAYNLRGQAKVADILASIDNAIRST